MKLFNLTEALQGEPVVTRGGQKVTDLHFFPGATKEGSPLYGVVDGSIYNFTTDGRFLEGRTHHLDLFMQSKVIKGYIAVGNPDHGYGTLLFATHVFDTEEKARAAYAHGSRKLKVLKVIEVEVEL